MMSTGGDDMQLTRLMLNVFSKRTGRPVASIASDVEDRQNPDEFFQYRELGKI